MHTHHALFEMFQCYEITQNLTVMYLLYPKMMEKVPGLVPVIKLYLKKRPDRKLTLLLKASY